MNLRRWNMSLMILRAILFFNFGLRSVSTQQLKYPGNVTVVGLFEVYEPANGGCGNTLVMSSVMEAEAIEWYLKKLNEAGDLPLKIGLEGHMTCRQESLAAQVAIDVISRSYRGVDEDMTIGLIGPTFSSEAEAISPILSSLEEESRLLMIGYSTTSVGLKRSQYTNFFRVVPNDDIQVDMMVQSLIKMGWNRIAIIYENDIYGQQAMQSLKAQSERHDICIAYTAYINTRNGIDSKEIEDISRHMLIGSTELPSIGGFVFFGTSSTANLLLQKIDSLGLSDVPIGMFSEGIDMNLDTFRNINRFIDRTKGSLITSPTYRVVEEFETHWKNIFTNETIFEAENATNPWLNDLYFSLKPCAQQPCLFSPLSDTEFERFFPDQPLYVQYAIIAAHAMAKTFKLNYEAVCSTGKASCDLSTVFQPGQMINRIREIHIDFDVDFLARLESLKGVTMAFNTDGEPSVDPSTASYQLFNLRHTNLNDGDITIVKVGDFMNDALQLNASSIVDYQDDDTATIWPNVRKGVCGVDKLCNQCIPDDLPYWSFHEPGEFYIVGLIPVFDMSGTQNCGNIRSSNGYQLVESVKFAVQKINEAGGTYQNYFQGARVGVIILNTCNNPAVIQRHILNLHKDGLRLPNGDVINVEKRILGYAGPLGSTVSIAVSRVLSSLNKVSISYASTNPTLSDRNIYKYFMRVVSPDNEQANAIANILEELGANYVQVLYSEGAYGEGGIASLKEILKPKGICIIQDIKVPEGDNYYIYYEYLRKYPHAKIVIIFLRSHVVKPLMEVLTGQIERGQFVFIGSEAWGKSMELLENDSKRTLLGSYTMVVEMAENGELLSSVQKIEPESYSENPWSQEYLQEKWQCYYNNSFDKRSQTICAQNFASSTTLDGWATSAYMSALSMLVGSGSFLNTTCGTTVTELCDDYLNNPEGLFNTIKTGVKLDVHGNGISQKVFNDNGDGTVGYAIYNIQADEDDRQKLKYKKIGQYPLIGSFTFDKNLITYPTGEGIDSQCPNEQACAGCVESQVAILDGEKDSGMAAETIVVLVLFLLTLTAVVVLAVLLYRVKRKQYRDHQVYLTPVTPAEERTKTDYLAMPNLERPAVVGESTEICTEQPHQTIGQFARETTPASNLTAKESTSASVL